jgi:hypothetical protein
MYRRFGSLRASIALRVTLLSDAGRRALGLLDGRLLDECDRTAQNSSVLSPKPVHVAIKQ